MRGTQTRIFMPLREKFEEQFIVLSYTGHVSAQTLANRQLIGAMLERESPPDEALMKRLGFSIRCSRVATTVLFTSPTAMVVVTRTLPAKAEDTVDTRYQLSGRWSF